jgi:hypothetical protein
MRCVDKIVSGIEAIDCEECSQHADFSKDKSGSGAEFGKKRFGKRNNSTGARI